MEIKVGVRKQFQCWLVTFLPCDVGQSKELLLGLPSILFLTLKDAGNSSGL